MPVKWRLTTDGAKHHAEREASGIEPAFTLIEKFDNLTQTLRGLDEKYDHVIVDVMAKLKRIHY
jgi:chromosome partitioning protein